MIPQKVGAVKCQNVSRLPTSAPKIEVLDLIHLSDRDAVRATCKVRIGAIIISDVKVIFPVLASRIFIGWPSRKDGEGWRSLIHFLSPALEQAVTDAVIAAWRGGR